ncbi:hypothetical protein CEXT_452981 [Caerostris extrusa]|uniref:Uncharacterized protein n=1 Tax=Caerostris extrusa TaxID=172846 RepID=A0AAV4N4A6_CAEEX|nr:hypothetical protein CEXT_452981 [Caerostris extrusa]
MIVFFRDFLAAFKPRQLGYSLASSITNLANLNSIRTNSECRLPWSIERRHRKTRVSEKTPNRNDLALPRCEVCRLLNDAGLINCPPKCMRRAGLSCSLAAVLHCVESVVLPRAPREISAQQKVPEEKDLYIGAIFPINGTGGWLGGSRMSTCSPHGLGGCKCGT